MNRYQALLAIIVLVGYGFYVSAAGYDPNAYNPHQVAHMYPQMNVNAYQPYVPMVNHDTTIYPLVIATSGEDRIVDAIKRHSDLTKADEKRWTFSWVPLVGSTIHSGLIIKVRDFMRVCRGLVLAKDYFNNQDYLLSYFRKYKIVEVCKALDNLSEQGEYAEAVLGAVGTVAEKNLYKDELDRFIQNIKINKDLMSPVCNRIKQQVEAEEQRQGHKAEQELRRERNKYEANKVWWKTMALRWRMTKDVGTTVFNGAKWIAKAVNEYSVPLASAGITWYMYDRLFGTTRPATK